MKMKTVLVIPWKSTPSRERPLQAVLEWYKTNLPDIEIVFANASEDIWLPSASRNIGVKRAQEACADVVIINDADTIPEIESLLEAIENCQKDKLIHLPYRYCKYYTMGESEKYYDGTDINLLKRSLHDSNGGVWVFTPETWWSVGGMDEKFQQWGKEDTALEIAHTVIKNTKFIRHDGFIYCFGHVKQIQDNGYEQSNIKNTDLYKKYLNTYTAEEMLELVNSVA